MMMSTMIDGENNFLFSCRHQWHNITPEKKNQINNDEVLIRTFETIKTELKINWNTE
jgi:phage terminase large subunit GpA-like protein